MADFAGEAVDVEFTTNWVYFTQLKWMKKGPTKDSIKDIMAGVSVFGFNSCFEEYEMSRIYHYPGGFICLRRNPMQESPMMHCLSKEKQG